MDDQELFEFIKTQPEFKILEKKFLAKNRQTSIDLTKKIRRFPKEGEQEIIIDGISIIFIIGKILILTPSNILTFACPKTCNQLREMSDFKGLIFDNMNNEILLNMIKDINVIV